MFFVDKNGFCFSLDLKYQVLLCVFSKSPGLRDRKSGVTDVTLLFSNIAATLPADWFG